MPEVVRAEKEVITGKRKCGRKRKNVALEVDESVPQPEAAWVIKVPG